MSLRFRRHASPLGVFFLALPLACAQSLDVAGTLPEAYLPGLKTILQNALRQSPQIILKEIEIEQSVARTTVVNAQRLPGLGGHLDYAGNQTAISGNTQTYDRNSGFFYSLGLNQALFHWGALKNQTNIAKIGVLIAEKSHAEAYRALAVSLRRGYLDLVVKKMVLRNGRLALDRLKADLDLTKEKFLRGEIAEGEVGGLQLNFDDVALQLARAETEFANTRLTFAHLVGMKDLSEAELPSAIPKPAYPAAMASALLAGLLRDGGKGTFMAQVSALHVQEAELSYRIARVRLLPKFNATAGYSLQNTTNATQSFVSQTGVATQSVGVTAQWNMFDGFATRGEKQGAMASKRFYERQLQSNAEAALDQAQMLQRELDLDVRMMASSEQRRGLAELGAKRIKEEVELGTAPESAINLATAEVYARETNEAAARAALLARWSEFVSLAGVDPVLNNIPARYVREKR